MHDPHAKFDRLDQLMNSLPPYSGPAEFPSLVMRRLTTRSQVRSLWQYPLIQWLATGIGLFFTLGRLVSYIFSAWLSIQLAG